MDLFDDPEWISVAAGDPESGGDLVVEYADAVRAEHDELVALSADEIRRFPGVAAIESEEPGSFVVTGTTEADALRRYLAGWWRGRRV